MNQPKGLEAWLPAIPDGASKEKTSLNDYLAADGYYYPSDKLESYFKEPEMFFGLRSGAFIIQAQQVMNAGFSAILSNLASDLLDGKK